jgi:cell cycle sensor histidine kinase DivJ
VEVGARIVDSSIHLYVADTGIGIASDDMPRLGSPFFQVRSGYDRGFEGAGLGLSLVRGLVGLHGGTVLLESAVGVGTRVTVKLPFDCRNAPRVGAGAVAPQLETSALASIEPAPIFPGTEATIEQGTFGERKIA